LSENGFVEGKNVAIEYRWHSANTTDCRRWRQNSLVARWRSSFATGGEPAALAAKAATSTIPIVFAIGSDPIKAGLVAQYNRPGGNATGINILTTTLEAKRLQLIHEVVPKATTIGRLASTLPGFSGERSLRNCR
jgi:putative ABC transport system substrate-binding protein